MEAVAKRRKSGRSLGVKGLHVGGGHGILSRSSKRGKRSH
jgi:hypothetical protein